MRALVYQGPRLLTMEDQEVPVPGVDEVLLRVRAVGICGSEIEGYLGFNSLRVPPLVMGHEFTGEIISTGPTKQSVPEVGRLVTVNPLLSCGDCVFCRAGMAHVCGQRKLIGAHRPGAFAEYVLVPAQAIIPLPPTVDATIGALSEPLAVALHAVNLGQIKSAHGVVVWGAGSIGLLAICAARLAQPAHLIAVDTNAARLEAARVAGATAVFDARETHVVDEIRHLLSDVAHTVVLDAVGRTVTRQSAVAAAGPAGRVIFLGLHDKETPLEINAVIRNEVQMQGSYAYTMPEFRHAVTLLAEGRVPTGPWLEVRDLSQGAESFAELVDRPGVASKIILEP
ncbi:zinc-dependent alcohol dehydrogenase [Tengunoibacter tsumagoiensis]|uniref:Galactitol-1-phosphate 5-dehydrogenase n=1 Tax=Tengunoibacter tsumagoiensis TaxID=2014871 RepID=A0A402A108_9CHLR|nr:alcohol dehydrogenase catalytic domain-containing protein [Tengunoibacter tsumagoiensis]GCE12742.1 galactitol-1-phosphate 5-dehydrogenase [Tengunoibacter tsumagoiensis]